MSTSAIPLKKQTMPRTLLPGRPRGSKNASVRGNPIMKGKDARTRMLPIASRPLSKKSITPRKRKRNPKPIMIIPIFVLSLSILHRMEGSMRPFLAEARR